MGEIMIKKPMLSGTMEEITKVKFPVLATPKLDGIRCLRIGGRTVSRKFLDIPNGHIQKMMANLPNGLDGELMVPNGFNKVQSAVMSEDGEPEFEYWVFDYVSTSLTKGYADRISDLLKLDLPKFCIPLIPQNIENIDQLNFYEEQCLAGGHE